MEDYTMSAIEKFVWFDANGNPLESTNGALKTRTDPRTIIMLDFQHSTAVTTTLSAVEAVDSGVLDVADTTGFSIGDFIEVVAATHRQYFQVTGVGAGAPGTLNVDCGVDVAFGIGDTVTKIDLDMAVNGSVTPVVYTVRPPIGQAVAISRLSITLADGAAMDDSLFGALTALSNGVMVRVSSGSPAVLNTLVNWKTNGDVARHAFDVEYTTKIATEGLRALIDFEAMGGAVVLDDATSDVLSVTIQDDLTGLTSFRIIAEGYIL
jgi:hypothetical protein